MLPTLMWTLALVASSWLCGSLVDLIDVGPAMGRAGVVSASSTGGEAAYYNPAGLAFRPAPEIRIGVQTLRSGLALQGREVDIGAPWAISAELASPIPLVAPAEDLFAVGVMLQVLPDTRWALHAPNTTEPVLAYYQNRTQRLVVMPALSVRPHPNIALGVGMNTFVGRTALANGGPVPDVEGDLHTAVAAHAGVRWQWRGFALAFAYRQSFSVPFESPSHSHVAEGDLDLRIRAQGLYTPESFVWGVAYAGFDWDVAMEMSWRRWSNWRAPFARVFTSVPLASLGEDVQRLVTQSRFQIPVPQDVLRFGVSVTKEVVSTNLGVLWFDGGYAYEETPFVHPAAKLEESPINIIDGDKHFFGFGIRWRLPPLGLARFSLNLAGQLQVVADTQISKDPNALADERPHEPGRQTSNPGYPSLRGGGWNLGGTLSLGVELGAESDR